MEGVDDRARRSALWPMAREERDDGRGGSNDADTLASDDMTRDRLGEGIEAGDRYPAGQGVGDDGSRGTPGRAPLGHLLAENEPDQRFDSGASMVADTTVGRACWLLPCTGVAGGG